MNTKLLRPLPVSLSLLLTVFLACGSLLAVDKGPIDPKTMNEPQLLSQVRQLAEEKTELTQYALNKATTEKVKQLAQRMMQRGQEVDIKLNDLAAVGSVSAADKDNLTTPDEVSDVERMQGADFDQGYLKAMMNLSQLLIPMYEQLAARSDKAEVKDFARTALTSEHTQIKDLQSLGAK